MKNTKRSSKRLLSIFLALVMCLGMLNLTAFAAEPEPEEEPEDGVFCEYCGGEEECLEGCECENCAEPEEPKTETEVKVEEPEAEVKAEEPKTETEVKPEEPKAGAAANIVAAGGGVAVAAALTDGDEEITSIEDLKDVFTNGGSVKLGADFGPLNEKLTIGADVAVILDLNSKKLDLGSVYLTVKGSLTIEDSVGGGSVVNGGANYAILVNKGTLNIEKGVTVTSGLTYTIYMQNGTININGGTVKSTQKHAIFVTATAANNPGLSSVTVEPGSIITGTGAGYAIYANKSCILVVNGGELTGGAYGIYADYGSEVTVGGNSRITADSYGVYVYDAQLLVKENASITASGGIFTHGSYSTENTKVDIQGGTIKGATVGAYLPKGTMTMSGGSIEGHYGVVVRGGNLAVSGGEITATGDPSVTYRVGDAKNGNEYYHPPVSAIAVDKNSGFNGGNVNVEITGGTMIAKEEGASAVSYTDMGEKSTAKNGVSITGGVFSDDSFTDYTAGGTGGDWVQGTDGNWYVGESVKNAPRETVATVNGTDYYTLRDAIDAVGNGPGEVKLVKDSLELSETLNISAGDVALDLNGHELKLQEGVPGSVIVINANAKFTLLDTGGSGKITGGSGTADDDDGWYPKGGGVYVNGGAFAMNGGAITGNNTSNNNGSSNGWGGGVYVGGGSFTMNGGEISGNTAVSKGGGVYVGGGSFTMNGGKISGNHARNDVHNNNSSNGGGVYVTGGGAFIMEGGEISGNEASGSGGGVYVSGKSSSFTMNGGDARITGNTSNGGKGGGGVYADNGTFTLHDGEISGNEATGDGDGVYISSGTFNMDGGTIKHVKKSAMQISSSEANITGGYFSDRSAAEYLPENKRLVYDEEAGMYTLGDRAVVAVADDREYYTLQAAVDAAPDGVETTVTLISDISGMTGAVIDGWGSGDIVNIPEGKKIVLDLNGKSITAAKTDFAGRAIVNYGTLTVTGNGVIDTSASEFGGYGAFNNYGTLTITNGRFISPVSADGAAIKNFQDAALTINGGYFTGRSAINNVYGTLTVNGGEFWTDSCNEYTDSKGGTGHSAYCIQNFGDLYFNAGKVTGVQGALALYEGCAKISGGEFKTIVCEHGESASFYPLYIAAQDGDVEAHIDGGIFTAAYSDALYVANTADGDLNLKARVYVFDGTGTFATFTAGSAGLAVNVETPESLAVTGGRFSDKSAKAYVTAEGKTLLPDGTGYYVLGEPTVVTEGIGDSDSVKDKDTVQKVLDKVVNLGNEDAQGGEDSGNPGNPENPGNPGNTTKEQIRKNVEDAVSDPEKNTEAKAVLDELKDLDEALRNKQVDGHITVEVLVEEEKAPDELVDLPESVEITIDNAALNAKVISSTIQLRISEAEEERSVSSVSSGVSGKKFSGENAVPFSMKLWQVTETTDDNGETKTIEEKLETLNVPVVISIPVPADTFTNLMQIRVLHYHDDGSVDTIVPGLIELEGVSYVRFALSDFSDFVLAELVDNGGSDDDSGNSDGGTGDDDSGNSGGGGGGGTGYPSTTTPATPSTGGGGGGGSNSSTPGIIVGPGGGYGSGGSSGSGSSGASGSVGSVDISEGDVPLAVLPDGQTPFTDVPASAYYADAVIWAVTNGVTLGTGDGTTFSPYNGCTRAQFVTFLWRAAGKPEPTSEANPFSDIAEATHPSFYKAILWAVEQGITLGTGDGTTFSPDQVVLRAQSVTFMYRYAQKVGMASQTGTASFDDVVNEGPYYEAIGWAVANGITNGNSSTANTFGPSENCNRGMMVTFLYRLFVGTGT